MMMNMVNDDDDLVNDEYRTCIYVEWRLFLFNKMDFIKPHFSLIFITEGIRLRNVIAV